MATRATNQQPPSLTYRTIQSLRAGEDKVNFMGVVTSFTAPMKTKGSDYYCRVRLTDQTSPVMTCVLFSTNPDRLPQDTQCAVGDVMCLQGIKINSFQERTQGVLFSKTQGMWIVFARPGRQSGQGQRGEGGGERRAFRVAVAPGKVFHASAEEERMVVELIEWAEGSSEAQPKEIVSDQTVRASASTRAPVKLGDVRLGLDAETTICGVVLHLKPPTKTRKGGYFTSIVVTDETAPQEGFTMVLFGSMEEDLPKLYGKGDVILVKGLKIETFQRVLKGQGREGVYTAVVFSGHPRAGLEPRVTTGRGNAPLSRAEEERVRELKEWALKQPALRLEKRSQCLEDVTLGETFDLTCQVVATAFSDSRHQAVLTVWDGTQSALTCTKMRKPADIFETRVSQELADVARHISCEVVVYSADKVRAQPGDYVRLIHVTTELSSLGALPDGEQPSVQLYMAKDSYIGGGVVVLGADDAEVQDLKKRLPSTAAVRVPEFRKLKRPLPASVTTVLEPTTKRRAMVCAICECSDVPQHFLSQVKVKRVTPARVEDMCKLRCPSCYREFPHEAVDSLCPQCTASKPGEPPPGLKYVYSFSLLVEDSSGCQLDVFVSASDAEKFIPQLPPSVFISDGQSREALLSRLYYLTGGNDPFVEVPNETGWPRPWMECGIMSYKSCSDTVRFRIFDTVLNEWDL